MRAVKRTRLSCRVVEHLLFLLRGLLRHPVFTLTMREDASESGSRAPVGGSKVRYARDQISMKRILVRRRNKHPLASQSPRRPLCWLSQSKRTTGLSMTISVPFVCPIKTIYDCQHATWAHVGRILCEGATNTCKFALQLRDCPAARHSTWLLPPRTSIVPEAQASIA